MHNTTPLGYRRSNSKSIKRGPVTTPSHIAWRKSSNDDGNAINRNNNNNTVYISVISSNFFSSASKQTFRITRIFNKPMGIMIKTNIKVGSEDELEAHLFKNNFQVSHCHNLNRIGHQPRALFNFYLPLIYPICHITFLIAYAVFCHFFHNATT